MEDWTAENLIFLMDRQLSSIPSAANIVDDPQRPVWTHGSPTRQSNLEVERLWLGVTSNTEVPGRSVRWMVTLIVPNINRLLPPSTFPTTRGQIFQQVEAPCHTWGSTMKFLRGKKIKVLQGWPAQSPDMNIIEHIWGRMKRKLGGPSQRTWRSFEMPASWPSMPSLTTSSTSSTTLSQTGWQLFCRPKEPIQDINYLTFNPWWNTKLIFFIWYFIYFLRKIKCIDYNLIDYYLRQDFCPARNWLVHHYQAINLISIYTFFCFDSF